MKEPTISAGKLDRRITIERSTESRNTLNEAILSWSTLATVWAAYEPIPDGERFRAAEVSADVSARFRIRDSLIVRSTNPKDRIRFDDGSGERLYDINRVKPLGRRVGIEITATARADLIPPTAAIA